MMAVIAAGMVALGAVKVPAPDNFPGGEASIADPALWGGVLPTISDSPYFYVGDIFRYYMDGADTFTHRVDFGGTSFSDRNWVSPYTPQILTIDIFNHAVFHTTAFTSTRGIDGSRHTIKVHDGGVFDCGNFKVEKGDSTIRITDGGYLVTTNASTYIGSSTAGDVLHVSFLINNATWMANGFWLGRENNFENIDIAFAATNSIIESLSGGTLFNDDSDFVLGSGTRLRVRDTVTIDSGAHLTLDDAEVLSDDTYTNGAWYVGVGRAKGRDSVLTVKGASVLEPTGFTVGHDSARTGRVVVAENAVVDMVLPSFSYDNTRFGLSGVGYLEIRDKGWFGSTSTKNGGIPIRFGINAGGYGQCDIYGGTLEYYGYGTHIGVAGTGVMNVHGGLLRILRMELGTSATETEKAVFRQTGGTVRIMSAAGKIGSEDGRVQVACVAHPAEVYLEGGVLECGRLFSVNPSYATVVANGGTIRRVGSWDGAVPDKSLITGIGSFTIGVDGFTIDTTGGDVDVKQNMTNIAGEEGALFKVGKEKLTFTDTAYDVANTIVAEGTFLLGDAASVLNTALTVTNNATFSLAGAATSVTLDAFTVTNGVLSIDPGDQFIVNGPVALQNICVTFSSLPTVDQEYTFLVADGELDASTASALSNVLISNLLPEDTHIALVPVYDSGTGKTTVTIAVKSDVPLENATVWNGSDQAWGTGGNWSAGLPTAATVAQFTNDTASASVTVAADAVAGALLFAGQNYTLVGNSALTFPAEEGAAVMTVSSGVQTLDVPLVADATVKVALNEDTSLTIAKPIDGGGLEKTGRGKLTLAADNMFLRPVSVRAGMTAATTAGALGSSLVSPNIVNLGDATLEFPEEDGSALSLGQHFVINTTGANRTTIVKNERDVIFENGLTPSVGVFLKRGKGALTIKVRDGDVLSNSDGYASFGSDSASIILDEDGTPTNRLCAAFTAVEGKLIFKPAVAGTHPSISMNNTLVSGIKVPVPSQVQPEFVFEDVTVNAANKTFWLAHGCNADGEAKFPALRLVNATLNLSTLSVGTWAYATDGGPTLALTNATIKAATLHLTRSNSTRSPVRLTGSHARLECRTTDAIAINGAMHCDVSDTFIGWSDGVSRTMRGNDQYTGDQIWTFRDGSELAVGAFTNLLGNNNSRAFIFENALWNVGSNDLTLGSAITLPGKFSVTAAGTTGLVMRVDAGKTMTFAEVPLTGTGGLVKQGAGTVAFDAGMLKCTGKLVAEAGVLDLSAAGGVTNAVVGGGDGTILGGVFQDAVLLLDANPETWEVASTPLFADCSFAGRTTVSFTLDDLAGMPSPSPKHILVARYSGPKPDVSGWKLSGPANISGLFVAANNEIRMDVQHTGFMLYLR